VDGVNDLGDASEYRRRAFDDVIVRHHCRGCERDPELPPADIGI